MVRRHEGTAFMGGAHVFPGGRVDPCDEADVSWCDGILHARSQLADMPAAEAIAYHVAAVRELFEEAGVMLARSASGAFVSVAGIAVHDRFKQARAAVHSGTTAMRELVQGEGLRLALDALILFAHWVTPPIDTRQFDTRFFLSRVPPAQTPAHDEAETTDSEWLTSRAAMAQAQSGGIVLPRSADWWESTRELREKFEAGKQQVEVPAS